MIDPARQQRITQWDRIEQVVLSRQEPETVNWKPRDGDGPAGMQVQVIQSKADIIFAGGVVGSGKDLDVNTPIPTPAGWRLMGEIEVGDEIFDDKGCRSRVLQANPIRIPDECYVLTFDDGEQIKANAEHLWHTYTVKEMRALAERTPEWRAKRRGARPSRATYVRGTAEANRLIKRNKESPPPTKGVPTGGVRTTKEIRDTLVNYRSNTNHAVRVAMPLQTPDIELLPVDPYTLGCWLGDGGSAGATISCWDDEILRHIELSGHAITQYTGNHRYGIAGLQSHLAKMGLKKNKHIPPSYLRGSPAQRLSFLQGLMDTDGHCGQQGTVEFCNTNRNLAEGVFELAVSLGIKASMHEGRSSLYGKDCGPKYRVCWTSVVPVFRLQRKLARLPVTTRRTADFRYIKSCERCDPVYMRCIGVDAPSHLYLAGRHMVPTHNTQLLLGMAGNCGRKSIIFRRTFKEMIDIEELAIELYGRKNYHAQKRLFNLRGRSIELGSVASRGDEERFDGRPHDLKLFDEIKNFLESQFRRLIAWNRTDILGQRCRVVCAGNPPDADNPEQGWVTRYWAPWLDPMHPNPAKPGELRWFTGIDGKDVELEGPDPIMVRGELVTPRSRTFIPGEMVSEYKATGYSAVLQALEEPLRSRLLKGDYSAGRGDHPLQIIPSAWVDAAMERWKYTAKPDMRMSAVGVDPSRGGRDAHVIAPRYGAWYQQLISVPGGEVADGGTSAALCIQYRRDDCPAHVDVIGIGSSTVDYLRDADVPVVALNGSRESKARDRTGKIRFSNKRAQWHWEMREALDPDHGYDVCLPPDHELRSDLCAPRWKMRGGGLAVEEKEEVKERIGRSPDRGDAVIYALAESSVNAVSPGAFGKAAIRFTS